MINTSSEAFAPATMANLGVGFDILGLALREPGDIVRVERCVEGNATIVAIEGDRGQLSYDSNKNTACIAANALLKTLDPGCGVLITLIKGLPLASGLGSSAASAVAAAVAVNALFGEPLTREELLPACLEGEAAVSGYHADNVAPCLFGGITLCTGLDADQIFRMPVPDGLFLSLISPDVAVPTSEARAVLPKQIPLKQMVAQTGQVARLVDALHRGDLEALSAAMEADQIIEPARAHLMPLLHEARVVAKAAGALGLTISGAGPTLCAICDDETASVKVGAALKALYDEAGIDSSARQTGVAVEGAQVLSTTL